MVHKPSVLKPAAETGIRAAITGGKRPASGLIGNEAGQCLLLAMDTAFGVAALEQFRRQRLAEQGTGPWIWRVPPVWTGIHRFVGEHLVPMDGRETDGQKTGPRGPDTRPFVLILGDDGASGDTGNPCLISTFAWNEAEIGALDTLGQMPPGRRLEPAGPAFREGVAPVKPALEALRNAGIAALRARDCGHGLSNAVFYALLRLGFHRAMWLTASNPRQAGAAMAVLVAALSRLYHEKPQQA